MSSEKHEAVFRYKNTKWKCDVYADDGTVIDAGNLRNINTGVPWKVVDFCARYGMSSHEFLCMMAGHLSMRTPTA